MIVKDFCKGQMANTLKEENAKTGLYHLEWTPNGINFEPVNLSSSLFGLLVNWNSGQIEFTAGAQQNLARLVLTYLGVKKSDVSFYLAGWINEPGIEQVAYFITIEQDTHMRFYTKWKKYAVE
jgi:hypothetical protein